MGAIKFMIEITWGNEDGNFFYSRHIINANSGRECMSKAAQIGIIERDELDFIKVEILDHAPIDDVTDADMWAEWPDYEWD